MIRKLLAMGFATLASLAWANTEEVRLHSGERVAGELLGETETAITIRSALLGTIELNKSDIAQRIPAESPPVLVPPTKPVESVQPEPVAEQEELEPEALPKNWSGEMAFSYNTQDSNTASYRANGSTQRSTSDRVTTNVSGKLRYQFEKADIQWAASYRYQTNDPPGDREAYTEDDRFSASQDYSRDFSKHLFFASQTNYKQDIDLFLIHQARQSFGLGWDILENPKMNLNLTSYGGYQYVENEFDDPQGKFTPSFLQKWEWKPNQSFRVTQSFELITFGDEHSREFRAFAEQKLIENFYVRLRYRNYYDNYFGNTDPSTSEEINTALVYKFAF